MGSLLPFFLVYAGGILTTLPASRHFLFPCPTLVLTITAIALIARRKKNRPVSWALLTGLFGLGCLAPGLPEHFRPDDHILLHLQDGRRAEVTGHLLTVTQKPPRQTHYVIELAKIRYRESAAVPVSGRARIVLYSAANFLRPGDLLRIHNVRLKRPRNFKNPGRFDYIRYLESRGISVIGNVSKPESVEKIGAVPLSAFVTLRHAARENMFRTIDRHLSPRKAGLLKAMLLGEKQTLPDDIKEDYRAAGIAHLMAVSGLHIGFVSLASYLVAYPLLFSFFCRYFPSAARAGKARKAAILFTLLPLSFYGILVGAKVSALRAGIMIFVFLLAILVDRGHRLFNALLLAAFAVLSWNPRAIPDVGFQLSFMAVFSILFALHFIRKQKKDAIDRMRKPGWYEKYLKTTVWVTLAANLGVLPILLIHFNRVSLVGFFLNIVIVPFAMALIPLALLALALGLLWQPLAAPFMPVISVLLKIFLIVPHFFASLPYASVFLATPPHLWFALYYATLFGAVYWLHKYRENQRQPETPPPPWLKPAAYGLMAAGLWVVTWMVWPRFPQWPSEKLSVSILDVGGGESIFIEFPNHQTLLIDGGGFFGDSFDVGRFVVAPTLWNRGVGKIDYMAATHSDDDHIDGLESLLDLMPVGHLLYRDTGIGDARLTTFRRKALARNAEPITLQPGRPIRVGEVQITPLHPNTDYARREKQNGQTRVSNTLSTVLRLDYREFSMLFAADIGAGEERYLIENRAALRADFLKAPHHGSRFSNTEAFIKAVRPRTVFFSSGYHNPFHHPDPRVVQRYTDFGATVWRTDLDGAITITTDGYTHHVRGHRDL
ncbi:MAG: DNA internalization-related competence protein ComEC/Rec2 [Nitrospinales bacterium]